jgi:hypothetical protein
MLAEQLLTASCAVPHYPTLGTVASQTKIGNSATSD